MNLLQFSIFRDLSNFRHAISTRDGGFSSGDYSSLNLAFHVGDDAAIVRRNRRALAHEMNYDAANLVAAQQVHGANCAIVTASEVGRGALDFKSAISATDALATAQIGVPLLILGADCAPILLFDSDARVLAVVHAGWRGALAGVCSGAVKAMETLGAQRSNIRAGVGPCLCARNLEVGREVADLFADKNALEARGEKYRLDLRALIANDLKNAGVDQIEISEICPRDENEAFFSHRGQNGRAGRFGIVAWME